MVSSLKIFLAYHSPQRTFSVSVKANSVSCFSQGIGFQLSEDPTTSDLFAETGLNITLYTGSPFVQLDPADFNRDSGYVQLSYAKYEIVATTAYGTNSVSAGR